MSVIGRVLQLGSLVIAVVMLGSSILLLVAPSGSWSTPEVVPDAAPESEASPAPRIVGPTQDASDEATPSASPAGNRPTVSPPPPLTPSPSVAVPLEPTMPPATPAPTPTPTPTRPAPTATADPTTRATATTLPDTVSETSTQAPTPSTLSPVAALLARAPVRGCEEFTGAGNYDPFEYEAQVAIACDDPAKVVKELALFQFPDVEIIGGLLRVPDRRGQGAIAPARRCLHGRQVRRTEVGAWKHRVLDVHDRLEDGARPLDG